MKKIIYNLLSLISAEFIFIISAIILIHATALPLQAATGRICGFVFADNNQNGKKDDDESGLGSVKVELFKSGSLYSTVYTDLYGGYCFNNLPQGEYKVKQTDQIRYLSTTPNEIFINLADCEEKFNQNFGDIKSGIIKGIVYNDLNRNSYLDFGEPPLENVRVEIFKDGNKIDEQLTSSDGKYNFSLLYPARYKIIEVDPSGFISTTPNEIYKTIGIDEISIINFGDAGCPSKGRICGFVFNDNNQNKIKDEGEYGIEAVKIEIFKGSTLCKSVFTDVNGAYCFNDLDVPSQCEFKIKETDPSGYLSTTSNEITGTILPGEEKFNQNFGDIKSAEICGTVFEDINKNGIQDFGEPSLDKVKVELYKGGVKIDEYLTDLNGQYNFKSLFPHTYKLKEIDLPGYTSTTPNEVEKSLDVGEKATINFGDVKLTCSIGNFVWNDLNKDGVQNYGEPGLPNILIKLYDHQNHYKTETITGPNGYYQINDVQAGNYYLIFHAPNGFQFTLKDIGNDLLDSDADPATGKTSIFNIDPTACDSNSNKWDAGLVICPQYCSIGNFVWNDLNKDGVQNYGEPGLPNILIKLYDDQNHYKTETTTNTQGYYQINNVEAGNYFLIFHAPTGYQFTTKDVGNDLLDSDVEPSTGKTSIFNINPSACDSNSTKWDAGLIECASGPKITGLVFNDANGNGIKDFGETGIANVLMKLWGTSADLKAQTITGPDGKFTFYSLANGQYHVQEIDLPGYISTTPNSQFITISGSDIDNLKFGDKLKTTQEPCDLSKYTTYTQSSWESPNGCQLLENKFSNVFPSGVIIGDNGAPYQIKFTSVLAIKNFLPQSGIAGALDQSYINPITTSAGQFAGNVLALQLNVSFNEAGLLGSTSTTKLSNLVVSSGPLKDYKVIEVLNIAQRALGGTVCAFDISTLNNVVKKINENFDNCNLGFLICPPPPDNCGGGYDAGVESNGNLADLLLRRLVKIEYGQTTKVLLNPKISFTAVLGLNNLIPSEGPMGSTPKETTPFDILGISNATSAFAADYNVNLQKGIVRVASVFATTTNPPYIYEHTKAICDRLVDAELQSITQIEIDGNYYFGSVLYKQSENITDYTIHFSVYEMNGKFIVDSRWLIEDYQVPSNASNIYNFQVWGNNFNNAMYLVAGIIEQFKSKSKVEFLNTSALPTSLVYVQKGKYQHNGTIELMINNSQEVSDNLTIRIKSRAVQGGEKFETIHYITVQPGISSIKLESGIISDANVYITSSNGFKDEVFVSGGAYTYLTGSNSKVDEFNTDTFETLSKAELPEQSLILSGGAKLKGKLNDWITLFRSLTANASPYDLSKYKSIRISIKGYGNISLRLEQSGITDFNFHAKQIRLDGSEQMLEIPFSEFTQHSGVNTQLDASSIRKLSIYIDKKDNPNMTNFEIEVKNIAFIPMSGNEKSNGNKNPIEFRLAQNYPNPFNPSTQIEFSIAKPEFVNLTVYNLLGKEVATLMNEVKSAGNYSVKFNASGLSSGVYIYKIKTESYTATRKMILQK